MHAHLPVRQMVYGDLEHWKEMITTENIQMIIEKNYTRITENLYICL